MAQKTELKRLNRAFRKETRHWLGHPHGFASNKQWRDWCRENARAVADVRAEDESIRITEPINDQLDADGVVVEEMSNWF